MPRGKSIYQYPDLYPAEQVAAAREKHPEKFEAALKKQNKDAADSTPPDIENENLDNNPPKGETQKASKGARFIALTNFTVPSGGERKTS